MRTQGLPWAIPWRTQTPRRWTLARRNHPRIGPSAVDRPSKSQRRYRRLLSQPTV